MAQRAQQIASHLNFPAGLLAGQVAIMVIRAQEIYILCFFGAVPNLLPGFADTNKITGSGQGIGAECAQLFANEGCKVVVCDVDSSKSNAVAQAINEASPNRAISVPGDITDPNHIPILVKKAAEFGNGKIHIIVNNAGYTWDGVIHKMIDEQWDKILAVHNTAAFKLIREVAPYFRVRDQEARNIVNISSTAGIHGNAGQANYSLAKAGLIGLTKTVAKEWGPQASPIFTLYCSSANMTKFGVRANTVAFGYINTRLTQSKEAGAFYTTPDGQRIALGIPSQKLGNSYKDIPLGRPGTTTEAANAVLAVCSPLFAYVNGQTIAVTGGRNM
ncbi:hypothetical protein VE02_08382 [Pseudogymnoascus sp. 03VT05]|nr:hypothetical protein VE02_08382 [Pseudogymnoascus sp. 03VT05]